MLLFFWRIKLIYDLCCFKLEERDSEIRALQRQKHELEERLDSLGYSHREDMNRIVAASRISEEEKVTFKKAAEVNE